VQEHERWPFSGHGAVHAEAVDDRIDVFDAVGVGIHTACMLSARTGG